MSGQFSRDLESFADRHQVMITLVVKKIVLDLFVRILKRTRVDTGYARGNWQVGVGSFPTTEIDNKNKSTSPAPAMQALSSYEAREEQSVFVVNSCHYIRYLEYGTESFEGDHMVSRTVEEFRSFVSDAVKIT